MEILKEVNLKFINFIKNKIFLPQIDITKHLFENLVR